MAGLLDGEALDGFRIELDPARERADIVLDCPPLNIVSMRGRDQIRRALEAADADPRVRVIVMRAEGRHFTSGGNIQGFLKETPEVLARLAVNVGTPARCAKPVIAASRGYCFGVGFEFALACDFRIVSETCEYSLPEQKLGMIPGSGGTGRLLKMVGLTRATDVIMRARRVPAAEALAWGIATACVKDDMLEAATDALVDELRAMAPLAQRALKTLLNQTEELPLAEAIAKEGEAYSRLRNTADFHEGVRAFLEKRKPQFRGI